jgi:acyl-CoA thioester hydrolase
LPAEVKGASITLHQTVTRGDDVLVEARVRVAFVSGGRARPIPKALRGAMGERSDAVLRTAMGAGRPPGAAD